MEVSCRKDQLRGRYQVEEGDVVIATPMVVITMVIHYSDYIDDNDADGGGR